jgi:hypothetical protein
LSLTRKLGKKGCFLKASILSPFKGGIVSLKNFSIIYTHLGVIALIVFASIFNWFLIENIVHASGIEKPSGIKQSDGIQSAVKTAHERGRVRIVNNTLVADNGWLLRGVNPRLQYSKRNDQAYWDKLRDGFHLNTVRVLVYREPQNWGCGGNCEKYLDCTFNPRKQVGCGHNCQCPGYFQRCKPGSNYSVNCSYHSFTKVASASDFDVSPRDGRLTGDEYRRWKDFMNSQIIPYLDDWVNMAGKNGFYVIIDYHPVGGNDPMDARLWWRTVAPRYKDRTHVIYELMNEPSVKSSDNYNNSNNIGLVDLESDLFNIVRSLAPDTHIILWSFAHVHNNAKSTIQSAPNINYSNASVGFHIYDLYEDQLDSIRADYPVIQTEIGAYTSKGYNDGVQKMEDRKISWIVLDGTSERKKMTVFWDKDPYFADFVPPSR